MSWEPPKPQLHSNRFSLLGDWLGKRAISMLDMIPQAAYRIQMGVRRLAWVKVFLVNAPETVREVMVECPAKFPKHEFLHDILSPLIGTSLFNANGELWQQQRRLVAQAFEVANLRQVFPLMNAAVDDMLTRMHAMTQEPIAIEPQMSHVTADIMYRAILSQVLSTEEAHDVHRAFSLYQRAAQRQMGLSAIYMPVFWHRRIARKHALQIRETYASHIRTRYQNRNLSEIGARDAGIDMLAALINARDAVTGATLGENDLIDQVSTLFLAGHETSASTLSWALCMLSYQPQWQERIAQEAQALWQGRTPEFGDTHQLRFTQAVFKETLRLYPPIAFYVRQAAQDTCLRDKAVQTGDMVVISPWVIHRHKGLWQEPDRFDPERFLGTAPVKHSYLPFGLGERACPGAAFASQESVLILARIVQQFELLPQGDQPPQPVARLTLRAAQEIRIKLRVRSKKA
ncbi:cytochrome P450 [Variovorax sp. PCZ-1]|uniref:cytochrome P450 n=1 Tax=Variovorax sp. PCZ-1 TaxID=2835533 RepID=UPI001BCDF6BE|nr:cytochrome P450 [Variovorax sp. PCZ-1]MBS7807762.1 cytochrome P450 [Variovorax sp. PCZ-1]